MIVTWFRWGSSLLAMVACFLMGYNLAHRWEILSPRLRRLGVSVGALLRTTAYGYWEAARDRAPFGWRVVLVAVAVLGVLVSLLWGKDEDPRSL